MNLYSVAENANNRKGKNNGVLIKLLPLPRVYFLCYATQNQWQQRAQRVICKSFGNGKFLFAVHLISVGSYIIRRLHQSNDTTKILNCTTLWHIVFCSWRNDRLLLGSSTKRTWTGVCNCLKLTMCSMISSGINNTTNTYCKRRCAHSWCDCIANVNECKKKTHIFDANEQKRMWKWKQQQQQQQQEVVNWASQ